MSHTDTPIRGRFYATGGFSENAWGLKVKPQWHWHAEVWQGSTLLWADNCRDPRKLIKPLGETLAAFKRLASIGQTFVSWREIVRRAGEW